MAQSSLKYRVFLDVEYEVGELAVINEV